MQSQSLSGSWQLHQADSETIYAAQVPGGVHTDLIAAGAIPDPFYGDNELKVMWVAEQDWVYTRSFQVAESLLVEDQVVLVCDGLDTLGSVSINGQHVGAFDNMFLSYGWNVKELLKPGENTITFTFDSTVQYVTDLEKKRPLNTLSDAIVGGAYVRKAPSQFGWDWGPKLPPVGIWKDLRLEGYSDARLVDVHVHQQITGDSALVSVAMAVDHWSSAALEAVVTVISPDGQTWQQRAALQGYGCSLSITVPDVQLWWPNGYGPAAMGAQPLYTLQVQLTKLDHVVDGRVLSIGFRTIELRREPDAWGESFTFFVNGVPVFAKGADWIPADSFPTRISNAQLEHLIRSAAEAHMNMLRVWGGGFYEEERFYDLCDRYGILIWQDFLFACSIYPEDMGFFESVREEAVQNIRRLRHRASLALWCGNNEMEQGWVDWGWNKPASADNQTLKAAYDRMFHHLLPDVVALEDPSRTYWPSSASSGIPFAEPNSQQRGDCHYWDVWHGRKPFTAYRTQYPRFMSEFGFQSLPTLETIHSYADAADQNMTSYIMEHHQRSGNGNGLMIGQMTDTFRMPNNFAALVYLSMVLQAEGIRYGVEHWRRHKERVSGILYWQLNDCWPVASWSSIDYFGRWKALHYMARRFYAPILLSIEDQVEKSQMDVWVTSDLTTEWQGRMDWKLLTLVGEVIESGHEEVSLHPQETRQVLSKVFQLTAEQKRSTVFACHLRQDGQQVATRLAAFVPNKHLALVDPQLAVEVTQQADQAVVSVSAQSLARFVECKLTGADVVFSDNYVDVLPGEAVQLTCPMPAGWNIEQVRQNLAIFSLYQSFA